MDDADKAGPGIEAIVQNGIDQARRAPALRPRGTCHFCEEPVASTLLFCDRECAEDAEMLDAAMKRAGRNLA